MARARLLVAVCLTLLLAPAMPGAHAQVSVDSGDGGRLVRFNATRFNDTLFAGLEPTYDVALDEAGGVWYATQAGVVHVDVDKGARRLYTKMDGLPSSYVLGVATGPGRVYVGTDLGLAVLDRATGQWRAYRAWDSPLPDGIVREVALDGSTLWVGTHFGGVVTMNVTTGEFGPEHNTSTRPDYAKPVRRIVPTEAAVWVATDGDGVWRYDRASGNWSVLLRPDGLVSNTVLSVAQMGSDVWFGTDKGVQRRAADGTFTLWNRTNGMPDDRAYDLDVLPTTEGPLNLFAGTREGVWQLDPATGNSVLLAQQFGILGDDVIDQTRTDDAWVFATNRGVSLLTREGWRYYVTGPSAGPSSGPLSFSFTSASTGASEPYLWFGTDLGVSAFLPAGPGRQGTWYNFGEWSRYPGGRVNAIDVEGNTTWLATSAGIRSYNVETNQWSEHPVTGSRNLAYGLDAAEGELWVPLFGDGLLMRNLTTGIQRSWTTTSLPEPLPTQALTDLRVQGRDVWVGTDVGVLRMDRVSGTLVGTYTVADGLPGYGAVFRLLPDGNVVWVGMKDGGVARLDVATGTVTRVWNATNVPGFPAAEPASNVLSLHREGGRLWAGTKGGLVRIDLATGEARVLNQTNSGLVQDFVYGISSQDGILYLATASGVARMDVATGAFHPMQDAPDAQVTGTGGATGPRASPVSVRIDAPRDGTGVAGTVEVRGSASRFGGRVEVVEVRVGNGEWTRARGAESWSYTWDAATAPQNEPILLQARARSGEDVSRVAEVLVTPVALPVTPLSIEHAPLANATALRPLVVSARVGGDDPLTARLYYKVPAGDVFKRLDMTRQGTVFTATIPANEVQEGVLQYYVEARSGPHLAATSPEDATAPHRVEVGPPPSLAVAVEGPARLVAKAGEATAFTLNVTNVGSQEASFVVNATGVRAAWLSVPPQPVTLKPGESAPVRVTLNVPPQAFADNTTLTFTVADAGGAAAPARASVPVQVHAQDAQPTPTPSTAPTKPTPAPGAWLLLAAAGAAVALRRWRA